jgi:signal recognition particle receptor subunit beta
VLLKGIDGFVFVADSRVEALGENISALVEARQLLLAESYEVSQLPHVVQYNKRDLTDLVPLDLLRQELNPEGAIEHEAVATDSMGTMETVQSMAKLILEKLASNQ